MAKDKDTKSAKAAVPTSSSGGQGDSNYGLDEGKRVYVEICGTGGPVLVQGEGAGGSVTVSNPVEGNARQPLLVEGTGKGDALPVSVSGPFGPDGAFSVQLQRSGAVATNDQALWVAIRDRTSAISFEKYEEFVHTCLCKTPQTGRPSSERCALPSADDLLQFGVDGYKHLKTYTEAFLIMRCGLVPELSRDFKEDEESARLGRSVIASDIEAKLKAYLDNGTNILPYIRQLLSPGEVEQEFESPFCDTLVTGDPMSPCLLELIWSYWHEEGMLVQAMNAIALRFQNKRTAAGREILGQLEMSPLRPLANLIWGYIQDEPFRLTVARRTYEYLHQYGLPLQGRAVPNLQPAESRSRFLEAFHSLLYQVAQFYERDADTTVVADAFPVLNALKEVHLLLAEGAHNQFRDLPWTARVEMLIQQWLLSRREMREFLRGRQMVPYKERWMGQVDSVKRLYGMTETPVTHFRDLGVYGEQILLSIRYADWNNVVDPDRAKNWMRYWRPEIQSYVHAYRAATGIDLTATAQRTQPVNATPPAFLLQQRLAQQQRTR